MCQSLRLGGLIVLHVPTLHKQLGQNYSKSCGICSACIQFLNNINVHTAYYSVLFCRFGKVLWENLPEDMISGSERWGIETFVDLLLFDDNHKQIFNAV